MNPGGVPNRLHSALTDRYAFERELGAGGMATVWLAHDLKHDRDVALKVLRPELAASLGPERFLAEIRTTAKLQHPNIVALFDSGEADGFLYYVMPCIEGESLRARLERERQLDVEAMLSIARPVAQALAYAHELGVVHRDIKPENILLSRGQPFVTDFGIARAVTMAGGERLTATGLALGTPAYMSPEQALGEGTVDARSDIYSLGCVIYEMLSGAPPFEGPTVQALIAKRVTGPPPHLTTVSSAVNDVVRRSLATAPQDRFATAVALADALVEAARKPATPELSIVVLPFENLSPDPDNAFFADGLTDELISDLSTVQGLRVISRSSAMSFKGTRKRAPEIAHEVNVRYVLEGSVRRAGDSLRITAQLIDAVTDEHRWSGKYGGTLDDVLEIQEQVAQAIAKALEVRLAPGEGRAGARSPGEAQAYECYLRARQELGRPSAEGSRRALALLEQGLGLDPDSPLLLAMKGYAHIFRLRFFLVDDEAAEERAAADCVRRLRALAPTSGHAAFVEAMYGLVVLADMRGAIVGLERALRLAPSLAEAMFWLSCSYAYVGQLERASEWGRRLVAVDPLTPFNRLLADSWSCVFRGRGEAGASASRRVYEIDGENVHTVWSHGIHLAYARLVGELRDLVPRLVRLAPDYVYTHQLQALAAAMDGRPEAARSHVSQRLVRAARRDAHIALHLAEAYAQMGALDDALAALDTAVKRGFVDHRFFSEYDSLLEPLRGDARFEALLVQARAKQREIEAVL